MPPVVKPQSNCLLQVAFSLDYAPKPPSCALKVTPHAHDLQHPSNQKPNACGHHGPCTPALPHCDKQYHTEFFWDIDSQYCTKVLHALVLHHGGHRTRKPSNAHSLLASNITVLTLTMSVSPLLPILFKWRMEEALLLCETEKQLPGHQHLAASHDAAQQPCTTPSTHIRYNAC